MVIFQEKYQIKNTMSIQNVCEKKQKINEQYTVLFDKDKRRRLNKIIQNGNLFLLTLEDVLCFK
jgi:hypothetical protein